MFMYKLIKTISSEKYQANSLLFNKELDDKLRPENMPALFKILEKRNLNNFLSYSKVGLTDFEKTLPSRPLTAKSTTSNVSQYTQLKFDFNRSNSRTGAVDSQSRVGYSQSTSRLGGIQYGALTRPPTRDNFNNSRPVTREKSPKSLSNLSSTKNLNRCESARSTMMVKNMSSTDLLFKSQDELLYKSQSLHNLNTLIDDDQLNTNIQAMSPTDLKK